MDEWYLNIHDCSSDPTKYYGKKRSIKVVDLIWRLKQVMEGRDDVFPYSLILWTFWDNKNSYTFTGVWDIDFKGDRVFEESDLLETEITSRYPCWFSGSKGIRILGYSEDLDDVEGYLVPVSGLEKYKLSEKGKEQYLSQVPLGQQAYLDDLRYVGKGIKWDHLPHPKTRAMPRLAHTWSHRPILFYYLSLLENILEVLCDPERRARLDSISPFVSVSLEKKRLKEPKKPPMLKEQILDTEDMRVLKKAFMASEFGVGCRENEVKIKKKPDVGVFVCVGGPGREGKVCPYHDCVHADYQTEKLQYRLMEKGGRPYSFYVSCLSSRPPAFNNDSLWVHIDPSESISLFENFFDSLSRDSAEYIKGASLVKTVHTKHLPETLFYEDGEEEGVFLVSSTMGSGKTTAVKGLLGKKAPKRCLWISMRVTFSFSLSETPDGPLAGFKCYKGFSSNEELKKADKIVISPESLDKLATIVDGKGVEIPEYDVVIIDEFNSYLQNIASPTLGGKGDKRTLCLEIVKHLLLGGAKYCILTDAFIGEQEVAFLRDIKLPSSRLRFIYNSCFDCDTNKYHLYDPLVSAHSWMDGICDRVDKGKKMVVVSTARDKLYAIMEECIAERGGKNIRILTGDSDIADKHRICVDINTALLAYDHFGFTSTMTVGNSFDIEGHFDDIYVYVSDTLSLETVIQMIRRVRKPRSGNVHILFSTPLHYRHPSCFFQREEGEGEEEKEMNLDWLLKITKLRNRQDVILKDIKFEKQKQQKKILANIVTIPAQTRRLMKNIDPEKLNEREKLEYEKAKKKKSKSVDLCSALYKTMDSIFKGTGRENRTVSIGGDFKLKAYIRAILTGYVSKNNNGKRAEYLAMYLKKSVGKNIRLVTSPHTDVCKKVSKRAMKSTREYARSIGAMFTRENQILYKPLAPLTTLGNSMEVANELERKLANLGGAPLSATVDMENFCHFLCAIDPRYYSGNSAFAGFTYCTTRILPVTGELPLPKFVYDELIFPVLDGEEFNDLEELESLSDQGREKVRRFLQQRGDDIWTLIRGNVISSGFEPPAKFTCKKGSLNWTRKFYYILYKAGIPVDFDGASHSRYYRYFVERGEFKQLAYFLKHSHPLPSMSIQWKGSSE